ncbi:MAG: NAD-dependent epimerase/dehydratase family protein [Burkholderiales bacterium]|nr:NAD-dependent epimerase/dehydratase family protein [Phycisphaerae bacterium]
MRIAVTGGAGFIGSNLAKRLARDGDHVVAADTFLSADWSNLADFTGDVLTLEHPADVSALRGVAERYGAFDVIFHQAAITGVIAKDGSASAGEDINGFCRNNIEQFRQILDLAVDTKARVIWASSCSVYGRSPAPMHEGLAYDPLNVYAFTKVQQERLAKIYQDRLAHPIVGLRYSNVYGPGEAHKGKLASMVHQLARQLLAGKRPRIFEFGEQRRDMVYIDDVVEANRLAMQSKVSGNFNAGAGASWSFNQIVAELNRVLKTDLQPEYFKNPYSFTQDWTETDLTAAAKAIGYRPRYDLAKGIDAYFASGKLGV